MLSKCFIILLLNIPSIVFGSTLVPELYYYCLHANYCMTICCVRKPVVFDFSLEAQQLDVGGGAGGMHALHPILKVDSLNPTAIKRNKLSKRVSSTTLQKALTSEQTLDARGNNNTMRSGRDLVAGPVSP